MLLGRKRRVRLQLIDPGPGMSLPSVEGLLVARRHREYLVALPQIVTSADGAPIEMAARLVAVPRDRVAWIEVF